MKALKDLIAKKENFCSKEIDENTIFFIVRKIIQKEFGIVGQENVLPKKYRKGVLYLGSSGSLWSSEIWLRRNELKDKINKELETEVVKKIKI